MLCNKSTNDPHYFTYHFVCIGDDNPLIGAKVFKFKQRRKWTHLAIILFHFGQPMKMDGLGLNTTAIWAGSDPEQWKDWDVMPPISSTTIYKQVAPGEFKR